jgi:dihydrofolate synthase/folylpolyglutamate synthase
MDPIADVLARDQHGIKFGLDNILTLCAALDHPERSWTNLIVAGTNGKGSVTAMAAAALTAAGHRTGRYTSPHLVALEERIVVDGQAVRPDQLCEAARYVLEIEARCRAAGQLPAPVTFFELVTATAFEAFRRARVEVAVLEVGMGGRFDSTNVVEPIAGAITSIAYDHMRFLGDTLGEIAFEKAGIMRAQRPIVAGPLPAEAEAVIVREAADRGAHLVRALEGVSFCETLIPGGRTRLTLRTARHDFGSFVLGLRGRHQAINAIVAVRLLEEAASEGLAVAPTAIVEGLTEVEWPARLQCMRLRNGVDLLLDAAHNPAGAESLAAYLRDTGAPPAPFVFGAMRDKDVPGMLRILAPHASRFVFCQAHSTRALAPDELVERAQLAGVAAPLHTVSSPLEGLQLAMRHDRRVVVAGSIFLIGDLMPLLSEERVPRS